ncbi:MAG: glycosyltransferase, partial [Elusimicrobiota bacterium]|nr:glycosyltransferase [Endomicrobiia bacterium]MDW8166732.1 glycosyltransferase [Elusimicrobiota bacterium]
MNTKSDFKFSVLIPVYFKENPYFLKESLISCIEQTLPPNEIVIVKDGPLTSELDEIINKIMSKYKNITDFKIINLSQNKGLGKALQKGVIHCSYNIIARMDSDDICDPKRFEKQINFFINHPNIDLIGGWIGEFIDNPNKLITIRKTPIDYENIKKSLRYINPINHMTVMFKKSSVIKAGNYQDYLFLEDYYLWYRMIRCNMILLNIPEILVYVRTKDLIKRRKGFYYFKQEKKLFN